MPDQPSVIRWEDPPPPRRGGTGPKAPSRYTALADELRARPGRWAVIFEGPKPSATGHVLAYQIRRGSLTPFSPAGDFDAVTRRADGKVRIYARYLGDGRPRMADPIELLPPGIHELSDAEYFGPALQAATLSSTGAKTLLRPGGPARYRHQLDTGTVEIKREYDLGHAVHKLVLGRGPELVEIDAEEWRSKAVKEEVAAVRQAGGVPMRRSDFAAVRAMASAVKAHPIARALLLAGEPERTLIWSDPATGVMCRAKADWLRGDGIADLKTAESAAPDALSRAAHNFGYAIQAPFYLRGFRALRPGVTPFFAFISVEKEPPYLVHVTQLTERALAWGDRRVSEALEIYRDCTAAGEWPGYPTDEITDIDLPGYVRTEEY